MSPAKVSKLQRALDRAVSAINEALNEAQLVEPGATLYLEASGGLYAMKPEPESHKRRDTTMTERQSLVIVRSEGTARCEVGAW